MVITEIEDTVNPVILSVTIDEAPIAKSRARKGAGGRFYTPEGTAHYQAKVGWLAKAAMRGMARNEVDFLGVEASFYSPGWVGDVDNFVKALLDGCNAVVWRDDIQVVEIRARVHRKADHPRTEFSVYIVERRPSPGRALRCTF